MSDLRTYINNLEDNRLRALYGADQEMYTQMKAVYDQLLRLVEAARGDLLLITRDDARVLKDGAVVYQLSDEARSQDTWRRQGSTFMLNDNYIRRSILDLYLRFFPLILERDPIVQRYLEMVLHRPGELIVKLYTAASR